VVNVIKLSSRFPFDSSPAFFQGGGGFPSLTMWIVPLTHGTGNGTIQDHKPSKTCAWKTSKLWSILGHWI